MYIYVIQKAPCFQLQSQKGKKVGLHFEIRVINIDTPFLYNGRDGVMSDENGLVYMRARYYSPVLKRFINADTLHGSISNPQTLNRYVFCEGNPVMFVDPLGLCHEKKYSPYPTQDTESTIEMREDDFMYVPADSSSEFGYIEYNNELYPIKYLDYSNGQSYFVSTGYTIAQYHERSCEFDWAKAVTGYMPNELPSPDERAIFSNNGNNSYAVQAPGIGNNRISSAIISGGVAATNVLSFIQNGLYGVNLVVKVSTDSSNNKRASVGVYVDYLALEYPAIPNSIVTKTTDVDYFGVNEEGYLFSVYNNSSRK